MSLSANTTTEHDAIDAEIADWPESVAAKAPSRLTHANPEARRVALGKLRPAAINEARRLEINAAAATREESERQQRLADERANRAQIEMKQTLGLPAHQPLPREITQAEAKAWKTEIEQGRMKSGEVLLTIQNRKREAATKAENERRNALASGQPLPPAPRRCFF